jgi:hypothetical protein
MEVYDTNMEVYYTNMEVYNTNIVAQKIISLHGKEELKTNW